MKQIQQIFMDNLENFSDFIIKKSGVCTYSNEFT